MSMTEKEILLRTADSILQVIQPMLKEEMQDLSTHILLP